MRSIRLMFSQPTNCFDMKGIEELDGLEQKAKASGASQLVVKDLTEEFAKDYIFPCLRAGAIYKRKYLVGTVPVLKFEGWKQIIN